LAKRALICVDSGYPEGFYNFLVGEFADRVSNWKNELGAGDDRPTAARCSGLERPLYEMYRDNSVNPIEEHWRSGAAKYALGSLWSTRHSS